MKPERLARRIIHESPWVNLYVDQVRFPNGRVIDDFHLIDFPHAAVTMIAENEEGQIVFSRIVRYATGTAEWELPAGGVEPGETELEAARREVLEETGYASDGHRLLYSYFPMNGNANMCFHIVHCRAGERLQDFDREEVSEVRWFTRAEARQMIKDRQVTDGFTLTALLLWMQDEE
jgi:ADP-ribose pyrophosphatase